MDLNRMQTEAVNDGLIAKRDYEITAQTEKVNALADQVRERAGRLSDLARDVTHAVLYADTRPVHYSVGAFGHDTETIDALLATLSEESQTLANMRAAAEKTDELKAKYEEKISAAMAEAGDENGERPAVELHAVGGGAYL